MPVISAANRRGFGLFFIFCCCTIGVSNPLGTYARPVYIDELADLVRTAFEHNPSVRAAAQRVEQARRRREGLRGFFDPVVRGDGKKYDGNLGYDLRFTGGVDMAVRPGWYVSFETAENRLAVADAEGDRLFQTVLKASVTVPLLRDRGFREWRFDDAAAEANLRAAKAALRGTQQDIRRQIELLYIGVLQALSSYEIARAATHRVEQLLEEAKELVRLKVVPEYQLYPARMEVALARASESQAKEAWRRSLVNLFRYVGVPEKARELRAKPEHLVQWARSVNLPPVGSVREVLLRSGAYSARRALLDAARYGLARSRDELLDDLSLSAEVVWQGEDPHIPIGTEHWLSNRHAGSVVMLRWSRPLGRRAERAEVARRASLVREQAELLRDIEIGIRAGLLTAGQDYKAAREELNLVTEAVEEARRNLAAEGERFRLGTGRSRNVLDAQKDLTNVIQRQTVIAARLLRAWADYLYAMGYPDGLIPGADK